MTKYEQLQLDLKNDFGLNEPIIVNEIDSQQKYEIDKDSFRKYLSLMNKEGKIQRYENGIYYFKYQNNYFNEYSQLSSEKVIKNKFVFYLGKTFGYYSGYRFANQLSLTVQIPKNIEVVSNNISKKKVEKNFIMKNARTKVTKENYKLLQVFDLLTEYEHIIEKSKKETKKIIFNYLEDVIITKKELTDILKRYPAKTTQKLYFEGYLDFLTRNEEKNVSFSK